MKGNVEKKKTDIEKFILIFKQLNFIDTFLELVIKEKYNKYYIGEENFINNCLTKNFLSDCLTYR